MKTQALKSVTAMALLACLYATSVAFTEVGSAPKRAAQEEVEHMEESSTIHHWVTNQLGFPKFLERQKEMTPVMLKLHVADDGTVKVLSCMASMPELIEYVQNMIDGQHAHVNTSYYGQQFEMKINFRPM
jgi:hypothetical protein